ncbi:type II secretion system minor pseudopilin GspK [Pseudoduganella sp. OTU4001]|uniref:type II secretion system minor pseudopilin GspK n=1 Tax=Pseudoduganella sp. OTU4001 TaxID=3043854 RepID=UPI00313EA02D
MRRRFLTRQRGVAVVTALLLTTLAVSIVASLFWQQQVQVRSMENQRLHFQTRWILRGGLDLVRLILRQDAADTHGVTRADGLWATPLAETRLDQFVERERLQGESFDASISGQTYDAQSRYNLANLAIEGGAGGINKAELAVFTRLLQNLQLNPALARVVATQVARSEGAGLMGQQEQPNPNAEPVPAGSGQPMKMLRAEDLLSVAGFDQKAIEKLREFVVVLPQMQTRINVNTASAELLGALGPGMTLQDGQALVNARKRTAYVSKQAFEAQLASLGKQLQKDIEIGWGSDYFLVLSRVKLDRAELMSWSLVRRSATNTQVIWIREI